MVLSDGPAGLRITQKIADHPPTYQWATAWPIGTLLAQTWDRDLVQRVGNAIGKEMREYGATLWLAPGMNIHRDPLNGRNFEYYSEDPLIAGLTAAATTKGVQSNPGVGVTLKHFVANNQEANRNADNAVVSGAGAARDLAQGLRVRGQVGAADGGHELVQQGERHLVVGELRPADRHPARRVGLQGPRHVRLGRLAQRRRPACTPATT